MVENRSYVLLRDITARITKGSTPTSYGYAYKKEGIRFIKAENIDSKGLASTTTDFIDDETHQFLKRSILKADDVLFSIAGTIGRIGIVRTVDLPANTNQALAIIRPLSDIVDSKYLFHFLNSSIIQQQTKKKTAGVGRANVSLADVGEFEILLPPTIEDQKRIVAEIEKQFSRLDEAVTALKRIQANLKRYKAAVLKAAVEGKLTAQWRKDHPDVEPADQLLKRIFAERRAKWEAEELTKMKAKGIKPKDDSWKKKFVNPTPLDVQDLEQLPCNWQWVTLDEIGQEGRPIIYGIIKPGPHVPDGVPYVRVTEMKEGSVDVQSLKKTSLDIARKFARATLKAGDILISKDGTIGKVAVVPPDLEGGNITQHVMRAPSHEYMNRSFLVWAIRSPICQKWLTGETKGVALRGVNVEDFRRLPIPLPPYKEQQQILDEIDLRLSVTEELEATIKVNLKRAERLRQTILQLAFSQELK